MSKHLARTPTDPPRDGVDERLAQWARELPDVDTRGMAILGRARRLTLLARARIDAVLDAHGLDSGEADVLFTLLRSGPPHCLRPTEIFRSLMVSSGGMTHRLDRLAKAGLIRRRTSDEDGRSLLVELTEDGARRAEDAFRADMAVEAEILGGLSEDEQRGLADLLRKLALAIEGA